MILPSVNNHIEVGEASLDNPMEWDTIPAASYEKLNRVQPHLAILKKRSDQRIMQDHDFAWVRQEIERFKKIQAEKSVSLNEAARLKEKKETDDRGKARRKELAARPEPPGKIYDITLKLADQPGLPPPTVRTNTTAEAKSLSIPKPTDKPQVAQNGKNGEKSPKNADDDTVSDADVPAVDITVEEAKRILLDYIGLLKGEKGVALTQPGPGKERIPQ
jgi:carboxyl-terminal processing protease